MSPHVGPSWHQIDSKLAPSWPMLAQVDPSEPKLAPRWPQAGAKLAHVGTCWPEVGPCQERVSRRFESVASCNHESHIKHDDPLACDLWGCSNVVLLPSCLAMSFLSKRFIQRFPTGVPVDVSFLSLHLFRALHEGTLIGTW